ncbi:Flagellar biosynthesis protein, FliO [Roseimaritima multifibrata]|uniref:Flagellar biosynthesis protein, FliO n=1 Tax=Roseimaritima multifibrata TaxID=1930274 RepID=A0A517MLU7_9BACT|nr:flagellar biosynthetic protein FliO [Roseimaritima multifibrata]QDS95853.1 Flagellar biosynthesis protein, FliO [Roseimaritima multifibrata]
MYSRFDRLSRFPCKGFLSGFAACILAGISLTSAGFAQSIQGQGFAQSETQEATRYRPADEVVLARPGDRVTLVNAQDAGHDQAAASPFRGEAAPASRDVSPFRSVETNPDEEKQARQTLPLATVISSLAIVLGLFAALVWVWRRGGGSTLGGLSKEAFQVIGRSPLAPRQNMVLVRCGRRVLVLAVSGTSTSTLAEITDPDEVAELLALTGGGVGHHQFQQTLAELGKERPQQKRFVDTDEEDRPRHLFASV